MGRVTYGRSGEPALAWARGDHATMEGHTTTAAPLRIVIAEDDLLFASALSALLETDPRLELVAVARNGIEAVDLAERLVPDLVLMDLEMPGMGGVEATQKIGRLDPAPSVIIVSGSESVDKVREAKAAGAARFVAKSRAALELLDAIADVCAGRLAA